MKLKKALLIIDLQKDYFPRGKLSIKGADVIVPVINKYVKLFASQNLPVFASRDWHPQETKHFLKFGGTEPVHCVQNTSGAAFHAKLKLPKEAILLRKGMEVQEDSYSVFNSQDNNGQFFEYLLKLLGIQELYIAGVPTDYCVKYTVIDAIKKGLRVRLLLDALKGLNRQPGDSDNALYFMLKMGVQTAVLKDVQKSL